MALKVKNIFNFKKNSVLKKDINIKKDLKTIIKEIKIIEKKYLNSWNGSNLAFIGYSKVLAREALITETFVNRLSRETKRPIVVVGIERTGVPYTWSIKKDNKTIFKINLKYSSCERSFSEMQKLKLIELVKKFKTKAHKPLFLFIDSSTSSKMPSSFTGCNLKHWCSIGKNDSMKYVLNKNQKLNTKMIGYDWSLKNKKKYLPKNDFNETDAILFNPVRENKHTNFFSAYHDDKPELMNSVIFKKLVNKRIELLKSKMF